MINWSSTSTSFVQVTFTAWTRPDDDDGLSGSMMPRNPLPPTLPLVAVR